MKCEACQAFYRFYTKSLIINNNTGAWMLNSVYHMTFKLFCNLVLVQKRQDFVEAMQRSYWASFHNKCHLVALLHLFMAFCCTLACINGMSLCNQRTIVMITALNAGFTVTVFCCATTCIHACATTCNHCYCVVQRNAYMVLSCATPCFLRNY